MTLPLTLPGRRSGSAAVSIRGHASMDRRGTRTPRPTWRPRAPGQWRTCAGSGPRIRRLARTDGKGETWTLRKVVRRYLYHSIDHLRELDQRLARSEDRAARLRLEPGKLEDPAPLVRLFRSVGWDRRAGDPERVRRMLAGSRRTVAAWDGTELVGFAREHGDGVYTALISSVCVDPRWQGLGIAGRVVSSLMDGRPEVRFSLHSAPGLGAFYARFGFEPDPNAMVRPRQQ